MDRINEQNLQELGIFEIRNIAREVGVYSPTTLKKQELIDKIMKVINGEEEPYVKKTKQGRPPKNITTINDFIEVIVPKKTLEPKQESPKTFFNVFNDNVKSINVNELGTNEYCLSGLVKVYNEEYSICFLDDINEASKKLVFINNIQTSFYKLKTGDEISGKYVVVDENKPFVLKEIYSINQIAITADFVRNDDYFSLIAKNPCEKLKTNIYSDDDQIFSDIDLFCPLAKGQRILLKSSLSNGLNTTILHRLSTDANNLKGLCVLIDETPENYYELISNSNFDVLSNNYSKISDFSLNLEVKIARLLRMVEEGQNVMLFINDIAKLKSFYESQFILQKLSLNESAVLSSNKIKDIILLGKYTNQGSLTLIAGIDEKNDCMDDSLFNNVVCYGYSKYEYNLNVHSSKTLNIEKILTKSELNKLRTKLNN